MSTKKSNGSSNKSYQGLVQKRLGSDLTFGMAVASARDIAGMTQTALAKKLGITRGNLCDIEKGRVTVSLKRAADIAEALGYPKKVLLRLAVQDALSEIGIDANVTIEESAA